MVQIRGLKKAYGNFSVLRGLDMNINDGDIYGFLGRNGCGKTTLLRIIADLLSPTSGAIKIARETPHDARVKRRYGIVFQGAVLYEWRTVRKNIMLPLKTY